MPYKPNDHFAKKAKKEQYVARSVYKLIEIDDQLGTYTVNSSELNFLQQGDKVFITILRGNFKSIKVDQKNILLGAYLYSTTSVIVK